MCPISQAHHRLIDHRDTRSRAENVRLRLGTTSHGLRAERIRAVNKDTLHVLVGACVMMLGALFIVTAYSERQAGPSGGYELTARFNNIDGIQNGSDVLLAGVPVGSVSRVDFNPLTHQAILTLRLRSHVKLPIDTVAMVLSEGILGNKYLKLEPGGDLDMLGPGDEFEFVQNSVIFEELLQKVILAAEAKRLKDRGESGDSTN